METVEAEGQGKAVENSERQRKVKERQRKAVQMQLQGSGRPMKGSGKAVARQCQGREHLDGQAVIEPEELGPADPRNPPAN